MPKPDQEALRADLKSAAYLIGVADGRWGPEEPDIDGAWPMVIFAVSAAERPGAPSRYHVRMDCAGYPAVLATGTFWDDDAKVVLPYARRPWGVGRVSAVFRTDWENGRAFYHPFDRVAMVGHGGWSDRYRHLVWDRTKSIADFLDEIHVLLNSHEYTGVRGG